MKSLHLFKSALVLLCVDAALLMQSCTNKSTAQNNSQSTTQQNTLPDRGEAVAVRVAAPERVSATQTITLTGLLATANDGRLGFKIGGVIQRVLVKEGETFRKRQTLATLNTAEIDAQTEQARLGVEKATRDFARIESLYREQAVTQEQFQNVKTALDVAERSLEIASFNRRYARVVAEIDGFVIKKIANEGEVIAPGAPVLAVGETGTNAAWIVKTGVSDAEWAALTLGQTATVQFDAFPGARFDAVLSRKARAADLASGSFQVEWTVKFRTERPALGMFGKVTVQDTKPLVAVTIPYDALIEANGTSAFVFVPNGNRVIKKPITIQSFNQNAVVVASGLEGVREIVVSNSAFLNEQSTITIAK
jgi:RND family efflux transporter MFP subunit